MDLNLIALPYLIFRISPIIIVSFFVFQSFLLQDLKGVIYIAGLLITCILTIFVNNIVSLSIPEKGYEKSTICTSITIGTNGQHYSNIPLNLVTYSYTFFYLFIFILNLANKNPSKGILEKSKITQKSLINALQQNIPVLLFFPALICAEMYWTGINKCISDDPSTFFAYSLGAIVLGGLGGVTWAVLVTSLGVQKLQYIVSQREDVCSRPAKTLFRCKPKTST
jgi:hypothetical protein